MDVFWRALALPNAVEARRWCLSVVLVHMYVCTVVRIPRIPASSTVAGDTALTGIRIRPYAIPYAREDHLYVDQRRQYLGISII